ncbi:hypothetical protein HDV05_005544, partial [Chytridiales sp. JEL 0842]
CQAAASSLETVETEIGKLKKKKSDFGLVSKLDVRWLMMDQNRKFWNHDKAFFASEYTKETLLSSTSTSFPLSMLKEPWIYVKVAYNDSISNEPKVSRWLEISRYNVRELVEFDETFHTPDILKKPPPRVSKLDPSVHPKLRIKAIKFCVKSASCSREWVFEMEKSFVIPIPREFYFDPKFDFEIKWPALTLLSDNLYNIYLPVKLTETSFAMLGRIWIKIGGGGEDEGAAGREKKGGDGRGLEEDEGGGEAGRQEEDVGGGVGEERKDFGGGDDGCEEKKVSLLQQRRKMLRRVDFLAYILLLLLVRLAYATPPGQSHSRLPFAKAARRCLFIELDKTMASIRLKLEEDRISNKDKRSSPCWQSRQMRHILQFITVCVNAIKNYLVPFKFIDGRDPSLAKRLRGGRDEVLVRRNPYWSGSIHMEPVAAHDEGVSVLSTIVVSNGDVFVCGYKIGRDLALIFLLIARCHQVWDDPSYDPDKDTVKIRLNGKGRYWFKLFMTDIAPLFLDERKERQRVEVDGHVEDIIERIILESTERLSELKKGISNHGDFKAFMGRLREGMAQEAGALRRITAHLIGSFQVFFADAFDMVTAAKNKAGSRPGLSGETKSAGLLLKHTLLEKMSMQRAAQNNRHAEWHSQQIRIGAGEEWSTSMCACGRYTPQGASKTFHCSFRDCRLRAPRDEKGGMMVMVNVLGALLNNLEVQEEEEANAASQPPPPLPTVAVTKKRGKDDDDYTPSSPEASPRRTPTLRGRASKKARTTRKLAAKPPPHPPAPRPVDASDEPVRYSSRKPPGNPPVLQPLQPRRQSFHHPSAPPAAGSNDEDDHILHVPQKRGTSVPSPSGSKRNSTKQSIESTGPDCP